MQLGKINTKRRLAATRRLCAAERFDPHGAPLRKASASRLTKRNGFTLVEMLVVIAIIVALAAITLLFLPRSDSKLAADGAGQLQTWLASARSRALRDQTPTGVRLLAYSGSDAQLSGLFTSVQLIQAPEPLIQISSTTAAIFGMPAGSTQAHFSPGLPTVPQVGDMLEITYGTGSIHRIIGTPALPTALSCYLASVPPAAAITSLNLSAPAAGIPNPYVRIIRQPQPLMGEPALELPNTVFVNQSLSQNLPQSYSGNYDIIFAPSGQVINATAGRIVFWMADANNVSPPTLVTVYANTGAVAVHPIGPSTNYYQYTQDGLSSGQ